MTTLEVGSVFAGYRLESVLGRGGMAVVYLATDSRLGRRVALKVLSPELGGDPQFRDRFLRESRLAASLDHPHIIPIYEAGESNGVPFIAMRYVEGSDLRSIINREGPMDALRAVSIVEQVASALDTAHQRGLVHRDVKPANVLIVPGQGAYGGDHAYLLDFGLTRRTRSDTQLTSAGIFLGTVDYVAPEQIEGNDIDQRVDEYSLGCLLYECLTASRPFERDSDMAVIYAHLKEPPPPLNAKRPDVGVALADVLRRAMAKSRDERYPTCGAMAAAARAALEDYIPRLTIRDGVLAGQTLQVDHDVLLGRDHTPRPLLDPAVSKRHAVVRRVGRELEILDLGSRNGTWVNGRRVTAATRLHPGDVILVGGTSIEVGGDTRGSAGATVVLDRGALGAQLAAMAAAAPPPPPVAAPPPVVAPPPAPPPVVVTPVQVAPQPVPPATPQPPARPAFFRAMRRVPEFCSGPRTKWVVVAAWVLLAALAVPFAGKLSTVTNDRTLAVLPGTDQSVLVNNLVRDHFPGNVNGTAILVYGRSSSPLTDADKQKIAADASAVSKLKGVVVDQAAQVGPALPVGNYAVPGQDARTPQGGEVAFTVVPLNAGDRDLADTIKAVRDTVGTGGGGLEVHVTGGTALDADIFTALQSGDSLLLVVTGLLVITLLLLIYRAPAIALVPLIVVGVSYTVAAGIGYLLGRSGMQITSTSTSLLLVLMFGAGTDYCLLVVARYVDFLQNTRDRHAAVAEAVKHVGPAVIASGCTVMAAMLVLLAAQLASTRTVGPLNAIGIATVLTASMTLMPAVLAIIGRRGFWPTLAKVRYDPDAAAEPMSGGLWRRVGETILGRPVVSLVAVVALLAVGSLGLRAYTEKASIPDAFRTATDGTKGYALLKTAFPEGVLAPVTVVVQSDDGSSKVTQAQIDKARGIVAAVPDLVPNGVTPPLGTSTGGDAVVFNATLNVDPYSNTAYERVDTMRANLASQLDGGVHAYVGGTPGVNLDYKTGAHRDLTVIVPLVLLVIFLTLILLLRAVVAPLFLIGSVILSFFGFLGMMLVFFRTVMGQNGFDPNLLIFAFIFLVALGVDYNIFLMDRVRHEARQHGTRHGSLLALVATGPVITSAGLILAGTFATLTVLPINLLLQLGAIVAFGVFMDTLLVRSVLVPSVTELLGERTWWPATVYRPSSATAAAAQAMAAVEAVPVVQVAAPAQAAPPPAVPLPELQVAATPVGAAQRVAGGGGFPPAATLIDSAPSTATRRVLRIVAGEDLGRGVEVSTPVTVGRDPAAQLVLSDERSSRLHARFSPHADGVLVEDLRSANGTFVNGQRISAPVLLRPGDEVRVGRTMLRVE